MSLRPLACLFVLACLAVFARTSDAAPVKFDLKLASIPANIVLCRDQVAIQAYGVDHQYVFFLDLDGNATTGDPASGGADAVVVVSSLPQTSPCMPTPVSANNAFVGGVIPWSDSLGNYDNASATALAISVDAPASTLHASGDDGVALLARLGAASRITSNALSTYSTAGTPKAATDSATPFVRGTAPGVTTTDPPGDVQNCVSPCTTASWYGLTDILAATVSSDTPAFGAATLEFTLHVHDLPASLLLCRDPTLVTYAGFQEYAWVAGFDNDVGDGNTSGGSVVIASAPQSPGCVPHSVALEQALTAQLWQTDGAGQQTLVGSAPLAVDAVADTLRVQVDTRATPLTQLRSTGAFGAMTFGFYRTTSPPYASDQTSGIGRGSGIAGTISDPLNDLADCSAACSTAAAWYPMLDLTGFEFQVPDKLYRNGFD